MKEKNSNLMVGGGEFITVYIKSNMCIVCGFTPYPQYFI